MLQVVTTSHKKLLVYVGSPEQSKLLRETAADVFFVHADGDELDWIRRNLTGLPDFVNSRAVCWFGDHAKFIAVNFFG